MNKHKVCRNPYCPSCKKDLEVIGVIENQDEYEEIAGHELFCNHCGLLYLQIVYLDLGARVFFKKGAVICPYCQEFPMFVSMKDDYHTCCSSCGYDSWVHEAPGSDETMSSYLEEETCKTESHESSTPPLTLQKPNPDPISIQIFNLNHALP